jgi:lipopolysaccharide transport system ATP-binding protein
MTTNPFENTAVQCTSLGKCYQIYESPKARLKQAIWRGRRRYYREFWALRDVSFEVKRGESFGIIGHNGSGKSTLLQLICGTLTPTEGIIKTNGRIAALLELGSGFNPEFTGLENVYLNASMLGLSKEETEERLDDILAFADIGDFVMQPVKTYSSGMALRLAFAVVAHINADILIVDEALSVGDAFFTQKCMRFISRFRQDHCLLFVSHDANAITTLCERATMLKQGKSVALDTSKKIIELYTKEIYSTFQNVEQAQKYSNDPEPHTGQAKEAQTIEPADWIDYRTELINNSSSPNLFTITRFEKGLGDSESFGSGRAIIENVTLLDVASQKRIVAGLGGERIRLRVDALSLDTITNPVVGFLLKNEKGLTLLGDNTLNQRTEPRADSYRTLEKGGRYYAEFEFTLPLLPTGKYSFTISLAEGSQEVHSQLQWMNDALLLESLNNCVSAGLAGVPMHKIVLELAKSDDEQ